eukprot:9897799-Karenia_brevis.AAC.1
MSCETTDNKRLYFCIKCGAWAVRKCVKLMSPCTGSAPAYSAGWQALRRIERGRRPDAVEGILDAASRHA